LPTWHRWRDIFALAHVAVSHRPGFPVEAASLPPALAEVFNQRRLNDPSALRDAAAGGIVTFAMTQLAISATQIRMLLANVKSPRYLLPDTVLDYITAHQLYKSI
jgi:nicotinate-nucleotide adenylyltransferase